MEPPQTRTLPKGAFGAAGLPTPDTGNGTGNVREELYAADLLATPTKSKSHSEVAPDTTLETDGDADPYGWDEDWDQDPDIREILEKPQQPELTKRGPLFAAPSKNKFLPLTDDTRGS
jgi:hypothetical protein